MSIAPYFYAFAQIAVPISVALQLGYDFAQTNHTLQRKLTEVVILSAEKQQILSTQNETLEKQVHERTAELEHKNRDLEIEGALEKIRSASLAMHHSDEIESVVSVLFEKLKELGLVFDGGAAIHIFSEGSKDAAIWVVSPQQLPTKINLPYDEAAFVANPIIQDVWHAKETGDSIFNKIYSFEEKNRYFHYVFVHNDDTKVPEMGRNFILNASNYTASFIAEKNSLLGANSWTGQLFSETDFEILKRIARVFEQAYIRFLDLQKAEVQAEQAKLDLIQIQTEKKRAEDALSELRSTQKQLIQKEKLASLGELTAGIAHEIQNPLNFVNNFSELSGELVDEMKEEIDNGNLEEVKSIAGDLKQNLEKINHHGKRASSIVKGMLEHSRASTGIKELTDINALADEYLRLSYHGLRAKDKNGSTPRFNADFKTNFDQNLPKLEVIPQDFGRVLLNLINNAFYAVQQKNKLNLEGYKPLVNIETHLEEDEIVIKIQDNGSGMPDSVKAKIFQPFFTTKPTGEGTGLGLSLAYDIITKAHGGTIEVESTEGEGTTFIINLPIN